VQYEGRSFDVDVRVCALCGGHLRVLAKITDSGTAGRSLGALGERAGAFFVRTRGEHLPSVITERSEFPPLSF